MLLVPPPLSPGAPGDDIDCNAAMPSMSRAISEDVAVPVNPLSSTAETMTTTLPMYDSKTLVTVGFVLCSVTSNGAAGVDLSC